jgi:heme/copper-type cytochrome/quinol oxidase subunit 2
MATLAFSSESVALDPEKGRPARRSNTLAIALGVTFGILAIIAIVVGVYCYWRHREAWAQETDSQSDETDFNVDPFSDNNI